MVIGSKIEDKEQESVSISKQLFSKEIAKKGKKTLFGELASNHGSLDKVIRIFKDKIWGDIRRDSHA